MLPTRRPASFLASATETSRTASGCPSTRLPSAAAIRAGDGTAGGGGVGGAERRRRRGTHGVDCMAAGARRYRSALPQHGRAVPGLVALVEAHLRPQAPREREHRRRAMPGEPGRVGELGRAEEVEDEPATRGRPAVADAAVELARRQEIQRAREDHHVGADGHRRRVADEVAGDDRAVRIAPAARRPHEPGLGLEAGVVGGLDAARAEETEQVRGPAADIEQAEAIERAVARRWPRTGRAGPGGPSRAAPGRRAACGHGRVRTG